MLKWLKRHKREIFAFLACLSLLVVFALPCFAYDVDSSNGTWLDNDTDGYITFSSYAYDYVNDVSQLYNPPWLDIGLSNNAKGSYGLKSGQFQSSFNSLRVNENLNAYYSNSYTWFSVNATIGSDSDFGVRLTSVYSPFYLIWDGGMFNGLGSTTPFKLKVECDSNSNLSVNTDIVIQVSPIGGNEIKVLTFEDVGSWEISYHDIVSNIPDDWELDFPYGTYSRAGGLYVHKIEFISDVYSDVDDFTLSSYGVYHRFEYGRNANGDTLYVGNMRYRDLSEKETPPHIPTVEVINGYVYVDGVDTGIEAVSFEDIDWLQFTLEWLSNAVDGFLKIEFVPYVTLGTLLIIIVSFSVVMWWLKVFGGG